MHMVTQLYKFVWIDLNCL